MKTWDADQVRAAFSGYSISKGAGASGYAEGPFIIIEPDAPVFIYKVGTDGTVSRSKTFNPLMKITVRTANTNSDTNGFLTEMLTLDEEEPNGAGVGSFSLELLNGTTDFHAQKAWVAAWPKQTFDQTANESEWEIHAIRDTITVGGT